MVQFNLPQSSKIEVGKFYKDVLVKEYQRTLQKENFNNTEIIFSVGYMKVIEKRIINNFDVINLPNITIPQVASGTTALIQPVIKGELREVLVDQQDFDIEKVFMFWLQKMKSICFVDQCLNTYVL